MVICVEHIYIYIYIYKLLSDARIVKKNTLPAHKSQFGEMILQGKNLELVERAIRAEKELINNKEKKISEVSY